MQFGQLHMIFVLWDGSSCIVSWRVRSLTVAMRWTSCRHAVSLLFLWFFVSGVVLMWFHAGSSSLCWFDSLGASKVRLYFAPTLRMFH